MAGWATMRVSQSRRQSRSPSTDTMKSCLAPRMVSRPPESQSKSVSVRSLYKVAYFKLVTYRSILKDSDSYSTSPMNIIMLKFVHVEALFAILQTTFVSCTGWSIIVFPDSVAFFKCIYVCYIAEQMLPSLVRMASAVLSSWSYKLYRPSRRGLYVPVCMYQSAGILYTFDAMHKIC